MIPLTAGEGGSGNGKHRSQMTVREFLDHIGVDTYEIEQDGEPEISAYSKQYRRKGYSKSDALQAAKDKYFSELKLDDSNYELVPINIKGRVYLDVYQVE